MIYLDWAATAPLLQTAQQAWLDAAAVTGNASATHAAGRAARSILEDARETIAEVLGVDPPEVILTSGGTEADNLAIAGPATRGRVLFSAIEHPAIREAAELHAPQHDVIPVTEDGVIDLEALDTLLTDDVSLVSVMAANNETGIIQPLDQIADLVRARAPRARIHTDAIQAVASLDIPRAYALSISGHKLGAPVGVGALIAARDYPLRPLEGGGGQERRVRSGTLNVQGAAALAAALSAAVDERSERERKLRAFGERIAAACVSAGGRLSGGTVPRLPHIVHALFPGADPEALLLGLDMAGIVCSTGSACSAGVYRHSKVLAAMGVDDSETPLRFSTGDGTTEADVEAVERALAPAIKMAQAAVRA